MPKHKTSLQAIGLQPFRGQLNALDAATAIQAARLNARNLLYSASALFEKGCYAHSLALSILSIEETGKLQIIMGLYLGFSGESDSWKAYRKHTSKTAFFNFAIRTRAQTELSDIEEEFAQKILQSGPSPEDLDSAKQLSIYSDCFSSPDGIAVHLPANLDWREKAVQCLTEAFVLVAYMRDYPAEELEVWKKYSVLASKQGISFREVLKPLHQELLRKGFINDNQWRLILKALFPDQYGDRVESDSYPDEAGGFGPVYGSYQDLNSRVSRVHQGGEALEIILRHISKWGHSI